MQQRTVGFGSAAPTARVSVWITLAPLVLWHTLKPDAGGDLYVES
jgi:hypothetical protein